MPWHQKRWQCSTWNDDDPGLLTYIYAYVGLWTMLLLIQIMACHLLSPKPSLAPTLNYCSSDQGNKLQWNLNVNKLIFVHENGFENTICKISTILLSSSIDTSKNMNAMPLPTHMKSTQQAVNKHWSNQYIVLVTNINPSTYMKIIRLIWCHTVDALAPSVTRSSATIVLNIQDKGILDFCKEGFQLPVPSPCR